MEPALAGQLAPTWRLMWHAIDLLRALPPGQQVSARWDSDKSAFTGYADYLRDDGPPQPRRDSAVLPRGGSTGWSAPRPDTPPSGHSTTRW